MKNKFNINSLKLFQKYKSEHGSLNSDLLEYASHNGSFDLLISFIEILYPDVIEYMDCIILKNNFDEVNFNEWMEKLDNNKSQVESLLNHLHLYDLFSMDNDENELLNIEYSALMIMKFWKFSLEERYPNKVFEFKFSTEPDDYGPTITFFQVR